jgi:hypothetical protein
LRHRLPDLLRGLEAPQRSLADRLVVERQVVTW